MAKFSKIKQIDFVFDRDGKTFEEKEVYLSLKEWIKREIPTARFWLMLKLRNSDFFEPRWQKYLKEVKEFLGKHFSGEDSKAIIQKEVEKLEISAWNTIPSAFLSQFNIPRVIRF